MSKTKLILLPAGEYPANGTTDPIRFYYRPVFGPMYRRRVELCLDECTGGERLLEVGFGSGITFLNLSERYAEIHGIDLDADADQVGAFYRKRNVQTHLRKGDVTSMAFYADGQFDTVLLISILEHLTPEQLKQAFAEITRVLKPGGQVVYGVPVERALMRMMFRVLGYNIRELHYSTEKDVASAAERAWEKVRLVPMRATPPVFGTVYEVGHFVKRG